MKVRPLRQQDWDQLLVVASGFLPLTNGDPVAAMSRAITAHAQLIEAVKSGRITAEVPRGRVRLQVPEEGGLALVFEPTPVPPRPSGPTTGPVDWTFDLVPEISLEVVEVSGRHEGSRADDAGPMEVTDPRIRR